MSVLALLKDFKMDPPLNDDRAAVPWDAADYSRHSSLQEAMAAQVLGLLRLTGNESVLDIGCGDGRLTAQIADRLPQGCTIGVDASPDMVAFATSTFVGGSVPARANLSFEVADARMLPYIEAFDLVVSFNALHWVPDQATALRGIVVALRQSGRAVLRLVVKGERVSLEAVAEQVRCQSRWRLYFDRFTDPYLRLTAAQYAELAEREGLHVLSQQTRLVSWNFGSDEAFFGFCKAGFGAWTRCLPSDMHDEFVHDVMRAYRLELLLPLAEANLFSFYQMDITLSN
jgi:trans-aconitate 2-methyltransferase